MIGVVNLSSTVSTTGNIHTACATVRIIHRPRRARLEVKRGGHDKQPLTLTRSCGHPTSLVVGHRQRYPAKWNTIGTLS